MSTEKTEHAKAVEGLIEEDRQRTAGGGEARSGATGNQGTEPILQFFRYEHLPENLQGVSKDFGLLAQKLVMTLRRNPERTVALRKLLEAKDAAVRAAIAE
jgi:hypothetical protein